MAPYGPQKPDDEALRQQVRTRIASGTLPRAVPHRLFGGHGANQPCVVCGEKISPTEVLYEVELDTGAERKTLLFFHLACHAAWQLEVAPITAAP